jgi:hypothetical protein
VHRNENREQTLLREYPNRYIVCATHIAQYTAHTHILAFCVHPRLTDVSAQSSGINLEKRSRVWDNATTISVNKIEQNFISPSVLAADMFLIQISNSDMEQSIRMQGYNATSFRICNCESLRDSGLSDCLYKRTSSHLVLRLFD